MDVKHIHGTLEKVAEFMYNESCCDLKTVDTKEFGELVDMVSDLAEAEYKARISKAMKEAEEEDEQEAKAMMKRLKDEYGDEEGEHMYRMGYNSRRYANGRYAPKGRGRRMGYMPPEMRIPYFEDEDFMMDDMNMMRMGYGTGNRGGNMNMGGNRGGNMDGGSRGGNNGSYGYSDGRGEGSRYGRSYDNYRTARRHYTENPTAENKKMMDESVDEAWEDVEEMIRKMYGDAEAQDKAKLKQKATQFIQKL